MSREGKIISIALLTIFIYAGGIFLQKGAFIFPFPLNEIIFFIAVSAMAITNFKTEKLFFSVFLFSAILHLLSNEFYWAILLNHQELESFVKSNVKDWFLIGYYIFFIASGFVSFQKINSKLKYVNLLSLGFILTSIFSGNPYFELLALLTISLVTIKFLSTKPSLNLWWLLFILELTKVWSLGY